MDPVYITLLGLAAAIGAFVLMLSVWLKKKRKLAQAKVSCLIDNQSDLVVIDVEPAHFNGSTSTYGTVKNAGYIALGRQSLYFVPYFGAAIVIPVKEIDSCREEDWFNTYRVMTKRHLVIRLKEEIELAFYVSDNAKWLKELAAK